MAFLRTHVQRRAAPAVPGVDLGSEGQQVVDDELLVGGGRDLESRLCAESSAAALHERSSPTRRSAGSRYLPVALLRVQRAPRRHLRREHIRKSPSLLCHCHVKERVTVRILHVERLRSDAVEPPQLSLDLPVKQSRSRLGSRCHVSALCVRVAREMTRDVRVHWRRRRAHRLLAASFKRRTFERVHRVPVVPFLASHQQQFFPL